MDRKMSPKKFFTAEEEEKILSAIRESEAKTSGEIRVHLAGHCRKSAYEDAVKVFEKLGMTGTTERNGILVFLALKDHQFAVIGDIGIHDKVPQDFWEKMRDAIQDDFQKGDFAKGLMEAIQVCGTELARYFPRKTDDRNELSDELSADTRDGS